MLSTKSWRSVPIGFAVSVCMQRFKNGITELLKFVLTFQFWLKYDNSNRHFTWRPECISACRCDWVGNPQPTLDTMVVWGFPSLPWILWSSGESPAYLGYYSCLRNPQPTLGTVVMWGIPILPWILWLSGEFPVHIGCCGYVGNPQPTLGIMVIWGIHHSHLNNCDVTGAIQRWNSGEHTKIVMLCVYFLASCTCDYISCMHHLYG